MYIIFWVFSFITFLKSWNAGWSYDSIMFSYYTYKYTWFEFVSLHVDSTIRVFYHSIYYILDRFLGTQGWDWYLLKISLHSFNAFLFYRLFNNLIKYFSYKKSTRFSLIPSVLFLVSPITTEVVCFQAAIHFLFSTSFLLIALNLFFRSLESRSNVIWVVYIVVYVAAIFTLESSYVLGFAVLLLVVFIPENRNQNKITLIIKFSVIPIVILGSYLILNKNIIGNYIGHYGSNKHLYFGLTKLVQNIAKLPLDHLFFIEYWKMDYIYVVYDVLNNQTVVVFLTITYILLFLILCWKTYKNPNNYKLLFVSIGLFIIFHLPVLNLGILYIIPVEEDRYLYLTSGLFFFAIYQILNYYSKYLSLLIVFIVGILGYVNLQRNVYNWSITQTIIDNSIPTFPYESNKRFLILASPVYANGVLIWDTKESKTDPFNENFQLIAKSILVKRNLNVLNKIGSVLQYNIINDKESPIIEKLNENTIRMTLPCCGKWWWKYNVGAVDYENDYYKVKNIGGWQQEVIITFKQKPSDMKYLFQNGDKFCVFNF